MPSTSGAGHEGQIIADPRLDRKTGHRHLMALLIMAKYPFAFLNVRHGLFFSHHRWDNLALIHDFIESSTPTIRR